MINFPDFEEQFEIFENLQSLHISINMANTQGHKGRSQLLMTGLQLPMIAKKGAGLGGQGSDQAAAAAAAAAGVQQDDESAEADKSSLEG